MLTGSVVRCEWSDTYICDYEPGFSFDFQNAQIAVITLPSSLRTESGKFKWHILGSNFSNSGGCSWDPKGTLFKYSCFIFEERILNDITLFLPGTWET